MKLRSRCLALLLAVNPALHAQTAPADTVIRAESREVLVDAVAVDKKGKFARDLAERDFNIREDGKEQKITSFSLESSGVLAARPNKHYIVMFFDSTTGGQLVVRQQASQFISGFASPDRYMAVLSYDGLQGTKIARNFTTDPAQLTKAVDSVQPAAVGAVGIHDFLEALRSVAKSLAEIRGRKAFVLFGAGSGVSADAAQDLTDTMLAFNKANVAIYSVGGIGLLAGPSTANAAASRGGGRGGTIVNGAVNSALTLASALADGTGGQAFLTSNNLAEALGTVAQEQDQYYLLGYTPTIESPEGTCHELRVKVDRGDLEVRARKGYCTEKPADALSGKPMGSELETRAQSGASSTIKAAMQLPWFFVSPNVARVNLAMEINPSVMKLQKDKGKIHGEFDLAGTALLADGSIAARISDTVKLNFATQQQADAFLAAPYHYENQFNLAPGSYTFRMAFSEGAEAFGKLESPIAIDPWDGQSLSASGIALSRDAHPSADLTSGLDPSFLEGQRALVSKDTEVIPAGDTQFRNGEPGFYYFEAYEPLLAALKPDSALPLVGVRTRVLDRTSGRPSFDSGVKSAGSYERPGNPVIPILAPLPSSGLPPGKYKLEVTVMRQTGQPVVRTTDFEVSP